MLGNYSNIGAATRTVDLSLFKDFRINERMKAQFRVESFNLTNTPQFNVRSISTTHGSGDFGTVANTVAGSNRQLQLAVRFMF